MIGKIRGSFSDPDGNCYHINHHVTLEDLCMDSDEIKDLVGDARAKVSVSLGMSEKDYGNGFDAMVSVTLTCDQDREIIGFAYSVASDLAQEICEDAYSKAQTMYNEKKG